MFRYLILPVLAALQAAGQTQTDLLNEAKDAVAAHDYVKAAEQFRALIEGPAEPDVTLDALRRLAAVSRLLAHPDEAESTRRKQKAGLSAERKDIPVIYQEQAPSSN